MGKWESFGEYLDVIDSRRYATNVACHIAHGPLRYYVMGERAYEDHDASADDVAKMAMLVKDAFDAGAAGFSTNRFRAHMSRSGKTVPGTFAPVEELTAIARSIREAGHGLIQGIADGTITPGSETDQMPELDMFADLSRTAGRPLTFSTFQASKESDVFRRVLDGAAAWNAEGAQLRPQIIPRSVTVMSNIDTYHPFITKPTYQRLGELPLSARLVELRKTEVRDQILGEPDDVTGGLPALLAMALGNGLGRMFPLTAPINYEPDRSESVKATAKALGKEPIAHFYDLLIDNEGKSFFALLGSNFGNGTLEPCREMLADPNTVSGLSDAGAHVTMISDCSTSTFHLTHWARDRTKGETLPVELVVHKLTGAPAEMYGFSDRGVIEVGRKADINVIDFEHLTIQEPFVRHDLPTGVGRILQPSTGYLATIVNGAVVRRNDQDTGERPGHLLRSRQATGL